MTKTTRAKLVLVKTNAKPARPKRPKRPTDNELAEMIEEATVDCYDELEQASGFYTMIEDHLAVPFATQVLGVKVSVVGVEMDDNGNLKAVCQCNGKRQLIGLIDLKLPKPPPSGAALRANDGETSESLKFSLEGVGQPSHGHAKQRIENEWSRWS